MNILYLVNDLDEPSGITTHIYHLLSGLATDSTNNIFLIYGRGSGVKLLNSERINIHENKNFLHQSRSINGFFRAVIELYRFIKNNNIDIIHSHHFYSANIARIVGYVLRRKTILTVHGPIPPVGMLSHFNADYVIAVNEHVVEYCAQKIKDRKRIKLIRSGVDLFPVQIDSTPLKRKLNIMTASRFTEGKGLEDFISAVSLLPPDYQGKSNFSVAGCGELEDKLKQLNERLGTRINFPGNISNLYSKLKENDIFVFTSTAAEGFPLTLVEAGYAGNLVITSDFNGVNSVFSDGAEALIFCKGSAGDLADKLKYSIDNYDSLIILKQNYQKISVDLFNINKMISELKELYTNLNMQ